ncbi:hypothetical protein PVK06_020853 [Gossypium arboreum]|uniref:Uncharacterized protein n=1 Tax=Gossypium arboreum TaxID=29729 RepID=A0ABR0PP55_GOSAR|nr:hypothetical protein PVK06_020853 [Gossypium arboreum]
MIFEVKREVARWQPKSNRSQSTMNEAKKDERLRPQLVPQPVSQLVPEVEPRRNLARNHRPP